MRANKNIKWPSKTREIINEMQDSTRWNDFKFREDDIVIATFGKSGTTWMQQIVGQLVFPGDENLYAPNISVWPELMEVDNPIKIAEAQTHRRFMKTHLPVDALVFSPKAKYIYVARDPRDVAWSMHNHFGNFIKKKNKPPIDDIRTYYHQFLDGGSVLGKIFWSHVQGWWNIRHLPNVYVLHYSNLKSDLEGQIRQIAKFLNIHIDEALMPRILANCTLEHMRERAIATDSWDSKNLIGGAYTFLYKGTNGRWRDLLSAEEIEKADRLCEAHLTPDCANWIRTGIMPD